MVLEEYLKVKGDLQPVEKMFALRSMHKWPPGSGSTTPPSSARFLKAIAGPTTAKATRALFVNKFVFLFVNTTTRLTALQ
jgi:hypothetical protein